eukprot:TRINITY_DN49505_c0_g1_i1.p1 TRINITY_DN49505_c0_g1~~TRINITY_DN49505_c0_g1_i1.p1  ORF type:complete len:439 (+),score=60.92 TRINITY_DN49505_c0_g1_i1:63-1319(+)
MGANSCKVDQNCCSTDCSGSSVKTSGAHLDPIREIPLNEYYASPTSSMPEAEAQAEQALKNAYDEESAVEPQPFLDQEEQQEQTHVEQGLQRARLDVQADLDEICPDMDNHSTEVALHKEGHPSKGSSKFGYFGFALALLGIVIHLTAIPVLVFLENSLASQIFITVIVLLAFLFGMGSIMNASAFRRALGSVLGFGCVTVCIVCCFTGGLKGLQLYTMPTFGDCDVTDIKGAVQSSNPPAVFMCYNGFLDTSKQAVSEVNGVEVKVAPVYIDENQTRAVPAMLALTWGDQEPSWGSQWGPCGSRAHSHEHVHEEASFSSNHSHEHVHLRMCGFAINVRHRVAWASITDQIPSAFRSLSEQHRAAGGVTFDVGSLPIVDLGDPTSLSSELKALFSVGLSGYALLLLGIMVCCIQRVCN